MKALMLRIVVLFVLLVSAPVHAQQSTDFCDIDLSQVYVNLANAQLAARVGNMAGTLQWLAYSRQSIEAVEVGCQSLTAATVPQTETGHRVIVYADTSPYSPNESLTKLSALAFVNGISLTVYSDPWLFVSALSEDDVVGAIYGGPVNADFLARFKEFYDSGGRLLLFYGGVYSEWGWQDRNTDIQNMFGVSLIQAGVFAADSFHFSDTLLPPFLAGLDIGIPSQVSLGSYLVVPGEAIHRGMVGERLILYLSANGNLILWPPIVGNSATIYFFGDSLIERFDNEVAALILLRYLSGML